MRTRVRRILLLLLAALVGTLIAITVLLLRQYEFSKLRAEFNQRTAGELIRYARVRLIGHQFLEPLLLPALNLAESQLQRPVPTTQLPNLSKGQQAQALAPQRYESSGVPVAESALPSPGLPGNTWSELRVSNVAELSKAMQTVKAGQTIVLAPGRYRITEVLSTAAAGQRDMPITVKAQKVGQVRLDSTASDIFKINHPFWVFENLHLRGACPDASDCKHAFLVQGAARSTVLRNNLMEDFNSHLQVNGDDDQWPDEGLVQFNTFTNTRPRDTAMVVAPINIIGASKWKLADNKLSNFVKTGPGRSSFGVLIRGAGHGNRVERNLLVCTPQQIAQPGIRTGISFGGAGSDPQFCRDQRCEFEQQASMAINNVLAHCNDFGIDVHRSTSLLIAHNTLINSAGIDVRGSSSNATVYGNLLDGRIRERDGAQAKAGMNEVLDLSEYLEAPDALRLNGRRPIESVPALPLVKEDFCGATRQSATQVGALAETGASCAQTLARP